jgi:hypothetical protein
MLRRVACGRWQVSDFQTASVTFDVEADRDYRIQVHGTVSSTTTVDSRSVGGRYTLDVSEATTDQSCPLTSVRSIVFSTAYRQFIAQHTGCAMFQFCVATRDGTAVAGRDWDQAEYWDWNATGLQYGDYTVYVFGRRSGSSAEYDSFISQPLSLQPNRLIP